MIKLRWLTGILGIMLWSSQVNAQQYSFINYSIDQGLPQTQVRDIVQDSLGYLWIATIGGVSRFDGYSFQNYSVLNGLLDNQVFSLAVDNVGDVWMGSRGGITKFDGHSFKTIKFKEGFNSSSVYKIYSDADTLWLAVGKGLIKIVNNQLKYFTVDDGLISNYIRDIVRVSPDELWIATWNGISILKNGKFSEFKLLEKQTYVLNILPDSNTIWIATGGKGLYKYENDSISSYTTSNGLASNSFTELTKGIDNDIWLGSGMGLTNLGNGSTLIINDKNGLDFQDIDCLFTDREGILWVGTNGGGLYKFAGKLITTYNVKSGLSSNLVMAIQKGQDKSTWIGTYDKGISHIIEDTIVRIENKNGLINNTIWALAIDGEDNLWAGTNRGISRITKSEIQNYDKKDGLLDNKITSLYFDDTNNEMWMGSINGYTRFKNRVFTQNGQSDGFPGKRIRKISKDPDGNIWFGTINGLVKFDRKQYKTFTILDSLPSNTIYCFDFDVDKMWIGTKLGLSLFENGKFSQFRLGESPGDFQINSILDDKRGRIWVGTNNGIYTIQSGFGKDYILEHYSKENGLIGVECNQNAIFQDDEGNIYIGTEAGMSRFDRNILDHQRKNSPPKVIIKELKLYLEEINWEKQGFQYISKTLLPSKLKLAPDDNYLTFDFFGIHFENQNAISYRFMLEGAPDKLSKTWSKASKNTFATFSNLPSGNYTFKVMASDEYGNWPQYSSSYFFTILTPYYATWWFRSLAFIFIALIVFLIIKWRINTINQERRNRELNDQAKMLRLEQQTLNANMNRHFIFNALNSIQYYMNKEDKYLANRYLSRFAKLIRKNLESSQTTLTNLSEEIERMTLYLELEQMRFKDEFDYQINVDSSINTHQVKIPSMLFQPYLENSVWHGLLPMKKMGHILITISKNGNSAIKIKIADNGIGVNTSLGEKIKNKQDHVSKGIEITQSRIKLFKQISKKDASVEGPMEIIENSITKGTVVILRLPLLDNEF